MENRAQFCKQGDSEGRRVLSGVEDEVVQGFDGTGGTGVWLSEKAVRLHMPGPTISDANYIRIASAFR